MALVDNAWYVNYGDGSTTGYFAVAKWAATTVYAAGTLIRQNATPGVNAERCFICVVAGTSLVTEPASWGTSRGQLTVEVAGPTWQECTGIAALNGDATNTPSWSITATPPGGVKNTAVTLGQVIKRDSGASYQICTIAGTAGNGAEPAFSNTAGTTTVDNTVTWTSLGVVGNFTGWQAPHARISNAFTATWGQAGNAFFIASESQETRSSSVTVISPGTIASPCYAYCVTKTTIPPVSANLTTGATHETTGNSFMALQGSIYYFGIAFKVGDSSNSQSLFMANDGGISQLIFKNCALYIRNTGTGKINLGPTSLNGGINIVLDGTTVQFSNTGSSLLMGSATFNWKNTPSAIAGATFPTSLFATITAQSAGSAVLEAVDLSALGAGKTLVATQRDPCSYTFKDCALGAGVTAAATPTTQTTATTLIDCDSGATNYRTEKYVYAGTQTTDTTIFRTGGASNGTPISWKLITTANSKWISPYEAIPFAIWNTNISTDVVITIYGIWGGGAVPNNDDIWFESEYLGSSTTPQGTITSAGKADNLAGATAWSSDASTWSGSTTPFKMTLTLPSAGSHPLQAGPIYIYVKVAKQSSTFYVDPLAVLA